MSVRLAGFMAPLGQSPVVVSIGLARGRTSEVRILRFGVLTFAKKFGIMFYCMYRIIVMSRTIAGGLTSQV
jgi:hypothetical protein